jgi:hypothetical protein
MLEVFLALLLLIAATIFLTQLIFRLGTRKLIAQLEARMRACEQIANQKAIPDDWLRPFQAHNGDPAKAKKQCMRKLNELIRFYEHTNLVDSAETRRVLLALLREQRTRWETLDWADLLSTRGNEGT